MPDTPKERTCQPCTACCDGWVRMDVYGHEVAPGKPCPYSTGEGCSIYPDRPEDPCQRFICGWRMADSPYPDWLRPDLAKVMVLPNHLEWQGLPVDVAVPVGRRIPKRALNWLMDYARRTGRPLIYAEWEKTSKGYEEAPEVFTFGPQAFSREIYARLEAGERLW